MSVTTAQVLTEVRSTMHDTVPGKYVSEDDDIRTVINSKAPEVVDALVLLPTSGTLVTLAGGTFLYTLPGTNEYEFLDLVRFTTDKVVIEKKTREWMAWKRQTDNSSDRPRYYAIEPKSDQTTALEFWPTPSAAEAVEGIYSVLPVDWASMSATAVTLPFSQRAAHALALKVSAALAATFNAEKLISLKLNPSVINLWERDAFELLRRERLQLSRLKQPAANTYRRVMEPRRLW